MRCLHRPNNLIIARSLSLRALPDRTTLIAHDMSQPASMQPATHPSSLKSPVAKMTHPTILECVPASGGAHPSRLDYALRVRPVLWTHRRSDVVCFGVVALVVLVGVVRAIMDTFPSFAHTVVMLCIRRASDILL